MAEQGLMAYGQQVATPKKKKKKGAYITKKKKYTGKNYNTSALAAGQQVLTARKGRKDRGKKKYGSAEAGELRRNIREEARKGRAKPRPFGEAFKAARAAGKDKFLWKGKSYHTKTKSELEKATTKSKREERFDPTKTKAVATDEQRKLKKRVEWMKKRKEAGKSYSAKNLAKFSSQLKKANVI